MFECEDTHWWYAAVHELVLSHVAREGSSKDRFKILDAGCGTGRLCQLLAGLGSVHGCDHSDLALAYCRQRGVPSIFKADLNTADLGKNRYDVITSIDVLYHKAIEDDQATLGRFQRALKPGGLLVLQVPAYEFLRSSHDIAVHTGRRYTRNRLAVMLRTEGFIVEYITYRVAVLLLPIALYRLVRKVWAAGGGRSAASSDVSLPPAALNMVLRSLLLLENRILKKRPLPAGMSVFALARKPPLGGNGRKAPDRTR